MRNRIFAALAAAAVVAVCSCSGSTNATPTNDTAAIRARMTSLISHFNSGDAKAILDDDVPASARRTCSDKDAKDAINGARQQLQAVGGKVSLKSVDNVAVNGSNATASVVFATGLPFPPETPAATIPFVKDGGSWRLDTTDANGCNGLLPSGVG